MLTVNRSENNKTGKISATYRGKTTCPATCYAFKVCYAKTGVTNIAFMRAGLEKSISDVCQFTEWIASLPIGQKIRHHVSGDFVKDNNKLDREYIKGFIKAMAKRSDLQSWGYTHAWKSFKTNIFKKLKSVTISASCDSISEIKTARDKGFDTVVIMPVNAKSGVYNNERVIICPNQSNSKITCEKCMLCFKKNRNFTVGFHVHGPSKGRYKFKDIETQNETLAIQPETKNQEKLVMNA